MKTSKFKEFTRDGRAYRIIGRWSKVWERGYVEPDTVRHNVLQVQSTHILARFFPSLFWKDVETEQVPSHAWISQMTLGDTGGWKSALIAKWMPSTPVAA